MKGWWRKRRDVSWMKGGIIAGFKGWIRKHLTNPELFRVKERSDDDQPFLAKRKFLVGNREKLHWITKIVITNIGLANALTLARLPLCLLWLVLWRQNSFVYQATAVVIYVISALTDTVDGAVARITNTRTKFGAMLDQVFDKLTAAIFFLTLLLFGNLIVVFDSWKAVGMIFGALLGRELAWLWWRGQYYQRTGRRQESRWSGKWHTWVLGCLFGAILICNLVQQYPEEMRGWMAFSQVFLPITLIGSVMTVVWTLGDIYEGWRKTKNRN